MHARHPARRPLTVLVLATALIVVGGRAPAVAHTEVLRASPGPGEEVAGPVRSVVLRFLDPVEPDVRIEVRHPSGEPVTGVAPVEHSADRRRASVTFPVLTEAGDYVVEYRFTALDGDASRETYRFTLLSSAQGADSPGIGAIAGALGVGTVVVVGLVVALRRRRRPG